MPKYKIDRDGKGRFVKGHPPNNFGRGTFKKGHKGLLTHPNKTSFKKGQSKTKNWYEVMKKHFVWNKGKKGLHLSPKTEFKKGMISLNKGRFGELSPNWRGGRTKIAELIRKSEEYKKWRLKVYLRDNFTCQSCRKRGNIEVHHIKELVKIIMENNIKNFNDAIICKELWDLNNGVTLCKDCHNLTKNGRKKV